MEKGDTHGDTHTTTVKMTAETERGGRPPGRADGLDGLLWEQRTEHEAECDAPSQCGRRGVRGIP